MFWVWVTILILTFLTVIVRRNSTTYGFLFSAIVTLLSYLLIKKFILQLGIFVVVGVLSSFLINYLFLKDKKEV